MQADTTLRGDSFLHKHDAVKQKLFSLAGQCHLPTTSEVFSAFGPCIPQRSLSRTVRGRTCQGMVPDFLFEMPATVGRNPTGNLAGGRVPTLGELKTIALCPSYMRKGATKRGVNLQADALPAEYVRMPGTSTETTGAQQPRPWAQFRLTSRCATPTCSS